MYVISKTTLTDIGDAVREKTGLTGAIPVTNLAQAIRSINTSGIKEEYLTFTDCTRFLFGNNGWNFIVEEFADKLKFENISDTYCMFINSLLEDLSGLTIHLNRASTAHMFRGAGGVQKLPKVIGGTYDMDYMFSGCLYLPSEALTNFFDDMYVLWERESANPNTSLVLCEYLFEECANIRDLTAPLNWLQEQFNLHPTNSYKGSYRSMFADCYSLDKITNAPVSPYLATGNYNLSSMLTNCSHLNTFKFRTEGGAPMIANWSGQTLDLTVYVGYFKFIPSVNLYFKGNEVKTEADYANLKSDINWYTCNPEFSHYNHASAVETINSLPDCAAYITTNGAANNTIKFKGGAGALTDGGAINTLTAEEIAVAAAKGWTVALS